MSEASHAARGGLGEQPARLRLALVVVCLGTLIGPLDTSVNVAFPLIRAEFGLTISEIQWIVASFILAQSGLTLAFGQLGDLHGYRRVFRLGMAACAITHLLCAMAPSYPALVAARVAQGIAVGLAMACGPALATLLFPAHLRRSILALYVAILGSGIALGPLLGGILLEWGGWPAVYGYRVPLALAVLVMTLWLPEPAVARDRHPRFDFVGAAWLTLVIAGLILAIHVARRPAGGAPAAVFALALLGITVLGARAFLRHESRFAQPILPPKVLHDHGFVRLQAANLLISLCGFSIFLLLPFALDAQLSADAPTIGLTLAVSPVGAVIAGLVGGRYATHWPAARLMTGGLIASALGLIGIGLLLPGKTIVALLPVLFLNGLGIGLFQVGYMDATTAALPPTQRGVAGSLLNVTRVVGAVIGAATITWMHDGWRRVLDDLHAFAWSFGALGALLLAFGLAGVWRTARR